MNQLFVELHVLVGAKFKLDWEVVNFSGLFNTNEGYIPLKNF